MEAPILAIGPNEVKIILALFGIESSNLLIHIPEGELVTHDTRNRTHLTTHKGPTALVDKSMPGSDIDPGHFYDIVLYEVHIRTKYKYLIMTVDIVEDKYLIDCRCICKDDYPILIHVEMIHICENIASYVCNIWIEKSSTTRKWRRNHFDNTSILCRSYMFIEVVYRPCWIKGEIVDSEHERTFFKVSNIRYLCMKKCKGSI